MAPRHSQSSLSRPRKNWTFRWASSVYAWGSNFGNSIGLAAFWFGVAFASLVMIAYFAGTDLAEKGLSGWQHSLEGDDSYRRLLRAVVYALHSINPLGLFKSQLVVVQSPFWAFVGGLLAVGGLGAIALFFVSLRRHFKLG
jgi:hypothetical protein